MRHARHALSPVRCIAGAGRSEEHTSELQSPDHLVCRLLLEKKTFREFAVSTIITSSRIMSKSAARTFHSKRIRPHPLGVCLRLFASICLPLRFVLWPNSLLS